MSFNMFIVSNFSGYWFCYTETNFFSLHGTRLPIIKTNMLETTK